MVWETNAGIPALQSVRAELPPLRLSLSQAACFPRLWLIPSRLPFLKKEAPRRKERTRRESLSFIISHTHTSICHAPTPHSIYVSINPRSTVFKYISRSKSLPIPTCMPRPRGPRLSVCRARLQYLLNEEACMCNLTLLVRPMTGNVILCTAIFETLVLTVSLFAHEQMASCNLGLFLLS